MGCALVHAKARSYTNTMLLHTIAIRTRTFYTLETGQSRSPSSHATSNAAPHQDDRQEERVDDQEDRQAMLQGLPPLRQGVRLILARNARCVAEDEHDKFCYCAGCVPSTPAYFDESADGEEEIFPLYHERLRVQE